MNAVEEFMRLVRENMTGRGFCEVGVSMPYNRDAVALMFAGSPVSWTEPFLTVPVSATGLELLQNSTPESMASLVRKRCAEAARAYCDRDLIYRPDAA
jgi:hypothetical protein